MAERGDPQVLKYVVVYLRARADMSQVELGKACRVDQRQISRYETGKQAVPEAILRRMAEVADVRWSAVVLLQRFYAAFQSAVERGKDLPGVEPISAEVLEAALLAVTPYLIEDVTAEPERPSPEEERREAEEIWSNLERQPVAESRELLGFTLRARKSLPLARRIAEASVQAAAGGKRTREMAELALWIAEQGWQDLIDRSLPVEAALAALDLAALWLAAGRSLETQELSLAMEKILAARGLDRRAREALRLFCDAGRQSAATPELARRVSEQLQVA